MQDAHIDIHIYMYILIFRLVSINHPHGYSPILLASSLSVSSPYIQSLFSVESATNRVSSLARPSVCSHLMYFAFGIPYTSK